MAASKVDVCNVALSHLGEARIAAITDASKEARALRAQYDTTLDFELRSNVWGFATTRAALPALADAPTFGFARKFALPDDYVRLVSVGEDDALPSGAIALGRPYSFYKIEGREILCDEAAPLPIRYVRLVTDVSMWDALFRGVMELALAYRCCNELTGDDGKRDRLGVDLARARSYAIQVGAIELPPEETPDEAYIRARWS